MIKVYLTLIFFTVVASGCSKDFLKNYNDRIIGTWTLVDVDRRGFGGSTDHVAFTDGQFIFSDDGQLVYINAVGDVYNGSWNIRNNWLDDAQVRSLEMTAVNFNTQEVRSEFFDQIRFTGTDRFKAFIRYGLHTFVFHFRR